MGLKPVIYTVLHSYTRIMQRTWLEKLVIFMVIVCVIVIGAAIIISYIESMP